MADLEAALNRYLENATHDAAEIKRLTHIVDHLGHERNDLKAEVERLKSDMMEVYRQLFNGGTKAHTRNALNIIRRSIHQGRNP